MTARWFQRLWVRALDVAGGAPRARMIALLASVLALDAADKGAVSAVAVPLKRDLNIGNAELGLIVTVVSIVGVVGAIPFGSLADRVRRTRLLAGSIVLWAMAMVAGGTAQSFGMLLGTRFVLGLVAATAGPGVASLTGDLFSPTERGRIYGYILAGELLGSGFGVVVAGEVAAVLSWRWAFWLLALPAVALAVVLWHTPEPARGGAGRLEPEARADGAGHEWRHRHRNEAGDGNDDLVAQAVREAGVRPDRVLEHPDQLSLWEAIRYVLSVRTNLILIIGSAVGYFFLTGLRTFALVFVRDRYGLSQARATALIPVLGVGALVGVLVCGRLGDRLVRNGRPTGRVIVAGACPLFAAAFVVPGLLVPSLVAALGLFTVAAVAVGGVNPPLDAARLDIMPAELWGRAEAVRTVLRTGGEALAPLLFGLCADALAGPSGRGLQLTFLIMTVPLAASGIILWRARRTYPADVANASASADESVEDGTVHRDSM